MITLIAKLLKILNSDDNPAQIALAVVFATIMGLTPLLSPHNILLLLLVLVIRVNLSLFLVSLGFFTITGYLFDPLSNSLGLSLLQAEALQGLWTHLYQSSIWRLLAYNNSLVLGSLTLSLLVSPLVFIATRWLITHYRQRLMAWVNKTRLVLWLKSGKLFNVYQTMQN